VQKQGRVAAVIRRSRGGDQVCCSADRCEGRAQDEGTRIIVLNSTPTGAKSGKGVEAGEIAFKSGVFTSRVPKIRKKLLYQNVVRLLFAPAKVLLFRHGRRVSSRLVGNWERIKRGLVSHGFVGARLARQDHVNSYTKLCLSSGREEKTGQKVGWDETRGRMGSISGFISSLVSCSS